MFAPQLFLNDFELILTLKHPLARNILCRTKKQWENRFSSEQGTKKATPSSRFFEVAGAGFEPTTFGL